MDFGVSGAGNIFPPFLGGFGVVVPSAGQKTKAEIGRATTKNRKTFLPIFAQSGFKMGRGGKRGKRVDFIGFNLVSQKKIDNIINIRNRSGENG